ncbi:MAG: alpha/beta hydrolase [Novosphingobium sp.]|uniref:alpha/beta fold hydrolase n=1 Tax=Novosphingobium sp. TaxID=1874826 RepID=UPI0032BDF139
MIEDRAEPGFGPEASERALLADDFEQLARALAELIEADRDLAGEPTAVPTRPAAIFAEAWLVCGLDAASGELDNGWEQAFSAAEREELEWELPAASSSPLIRFLHPANASPVLVLILPLAPYAHWPMIKAWAAPGGRLPSHVTMRLAAMDARQDRFNRARSMFRLTQGEERLLCRLAQAGNLRDAALRDGVKYETARTTLKDVLAKSGHPRQPALVGAAIKLGTLDEPLDLDSDGAMREAFGLSARQSAIARLFALGQTRDEVAAQLGLSLETIKAELKVVYTALGVGNATALAAVAAQIGLAARMLAAQDVGGVDLAASSEPVRLLMRKRQGGRIAFADYGPADRIPTFHFHTATTSRYLPRSYIAALQAGGLRPVTIDSPGFGLTEMTQGNYFDESAHDVIAVADALGAERFNVISRGARQVSFLLRHYPERLGRVVVVNPESEPKADKTLGGIQGAYKRVFYSLPAMIAPLANQLANRVSDRTMERMIDKFMGDSAGDRMVLADPETRRAHIHSNRLAALQGGKGLAAVGLAGDQDVLHSIADGSFITVMCGLQDAMYRAEDTVPRLQAAWPGMKVRLLEDAGRLLHLQHPKLIAAELTDGSRMSAARRQSKR